MPGMGRKGFARAIDRVEWPHGDAANLRLVCDLLITSSLQLGARSSVGRATDF
jgi:hypothetical protein